MDCSEFKKILAENPASQEECFLNHRKTCVACESHYQEAQRFENDLFEAFHLDEQDERLFKKLEHHFLEQQAINKTKRFQFSAIAASLLVLVLMSFILVQVDQKWSLSAFVLSHIDHEIDQLDRQVVVQSNVLQELLSAFDGDFLKTLSNITYARKCWMRTGNGLHLIFQGKMGPVTVLFMPNESINKTLLIDSKQFKGKVYASGDGSFALVGYPGEPIDMLAETLRMALMDQAVKRS